MVAGFAMVASSAECGDSGVMTFIINENGEVCQKDLGKPLKQIGAGMTTADPGAGWAEVPRQTLRRG